MTAASLTQRSAGGSCGPTGASHGHAAAGAILCALAPSIAVVIAGRFVQGPGGGLLSALAYVLARNVFPEVLWPRVFGLFAGVWSVSVPTGPLIGGLFAGYGNWRGAFFAITGVGGLLGLAALFTLPAEAESGDTTTPKVPALRVALMCVAVALLSRASVLMGSASKSAFIAAAIGIFVLMLRIDRRATIALLPSDAFSLRSTTWTGLWMVWLLSIVYNLIEIYDSLFLQRLHGLNPLIAGYMVAGASLAWTAAALAVAPLIDRWPARLIVAGPIAMSVGLLGVALVMAPGPAAVLLLPISLIGIGIGVCWAFILQRVMTGAKHGEENIAAASVATVQQTGIAFGAATAGLIANASGLGDGLHPSSVLRAALGAHGVRRRTARCQHDWYATGGAEVRPGTDDPSVLSKGRTLAPLGGNSQGQVGGRESSSLPRF